MDKKKRRPGRGGAVEKPKKTFAVPVSSTTRPPRQTSLSVPVLAEFREQLVMARARLVERIILEFDPEHTYPSTAWTRMVSDLHTTIMAVDDMIAEAGP